MIARGLNYEIRTGDCLEELGKLVRGTARLIVADPPYNIGIDYGNGAAADRLPADEYRDWCGEWVRRSVDVLTYDGSLWLIVPDEHAAELAVLAKSLGLTPETACSGRTYAEIRSGSTVFYCYTLTNRGATAFEPLTLLDGTNVVNWLPPAPW